MNPKRYVIIIKTLDATLSVILFSLFFSHTFRCSFFINRNLTGDENLEPKLETDPQFPLPSNQTNPTTSTLPDE